MPSLLQRVAGPKNLQRAWDNIKHRASSKGFDEVTISEFRLNLTSNLRLIRSELLQNSYVFTRLRAHPIEKGNGNIRPLRIPAVRDRVVQKAIHQIIEPSLNIAYNIRNEASFAYVKDRGVIDAVKKVRDYYRSGLKWVYLGDIRDFFGCIDPNILLDRQVFNVLRDSSLNNLIRAAIKTEVGNLTEMVKLGHGKVFVTDEIGIAQGGILSPLFSNVYLAKFDKDLLERGYNLVRYADDFVVMCRSKSEAMNVQELAKSILENDLKLRLHDLDGKKSKIERFTHLDFLGIRFEGEKVYPGIDAFKRMNGILRNFARRPPNVSLVENLLFLKSKPHSWASSYFYTQIDKEYYSTLDKNLNNAIEGLMKRHKFHLGKSQLTSRDLRKIGLGSFTECMIAMMRKKKSDILKFDS